MAQLCKNGVGECSGCGFCFGASVRCTVCGKDIDASREKYYIFRSDAICARCVYPRCGVPGEICGICGDGICGADGTGESAAAAADIVFPMGEKAVCSFCLERASRGAVQPSAKTRKNNLKGYTYYGKQDY